MHPADGHNMKLGRGGIREIEFFTQTRQLIAGGRDPESACQGHGRRGWGKLAAKRDWVEEDVPRSRLWITIAFTATVEHRVQMVTGRPDPQLLPQDRGRASNGLACLMGRDAAGLKAELLRPVERGARTATEGFFAPSKPEAATAPRWRMPSGRGRHQSLADLSRRFGQPRARSGCWNRLRPEILRRPIGRLTGPPDRGTVAALDGFLARACLRAYSCLALFEANPHLIDLDARHRRLRRSPALAAPPVAQFAQCS